MSGNVIQIFVNNWFYRDKITKMESKMKRVITYGTFDLLHVGHINVLRRAKELGDYLLVAISTDEFNAIKNKKAYYSFEDRKQILEAVRYVDEVIPENTWEQKIKDVTENNIDIFVMGHDWEGKFDFLKDYCEVIYLPRTEGISSSPCKMSLYKAIRYFLIFSIGTVFTYAF